jgi:RNA polymerase sigma factor (sigma-70 family)
MPAVSTSLGEFLRRLKQSMAAESLAALPDGPLVERFLAGRDEAAFQAILHRHGPMVFRVCRRVLRHEQDVEDAFQATFLVLARQARTIRKLASLASWLHGVAYRAALTARASAARRREHESHAGAAAPEAALPDEVSWKELRSLLDEELTRLPERLRSPLVLCYLEGLTQDEAARQLGWSKSTCRRNLERARELLGGRLARRGVTLSAALLAPLLCESAVSAAVSPELIASAAKAAADVAVGTAAAVPARVAALAGGLARSGVACKWKLLAVLVLAVFVAGIGGAAVTRNAPPDKPPPSTRHEEDVSAPAPAEDRVAPRPDVAARMESKFPTLILERAVQEELRLSEEQWRTIREAIDEVHGRHQEDFRRLRELAEQRARADEAVRVLPVPRTDEEVRARFAAVGSQGTLRWAEDELRRKLDMARAEALREVLPRILTPAQLRRLRQVELRLAGLGAFADRDVARALALTAEQNAAIRALAQEPRSPGSLIPASLTAVPDVVLQRGNVPRALEILTEDQRKTWADLIGEPCQLQVGFREPLMEMRRAYMSHLEAREWPPGTPVQIPATRIRP